MHFTLWSHVTNTGGTYAEITWTDFLSIIRNPTVAVEKTSLEGWSPARFRDNTRSKANVEGVSCIVLDDDASGRTTEELSTQWAEYAGVVHTSFSHTAEHPKHRIILRCSRDMSAVEHARVWRTVAEGKGLDEATKDPSRLWFLPGHREGAEYRCVELPGQPIDVDAVLADASGHPPPADASGHPPPDDARRRAMSAALAAAWPTKGRHVAQLALAGALRAEGWAEADAVDFLEAVAGERTKREATCRHTWGLPEGAPMTSWSRLKSHVDPVVVDVVRGALCRDAAWAEATARRISECSQEPSPDPKADGTITVDGWDFETRGLDAPLPPLEFQIAGLICKGDVVMFVAQGNSLKTWLAFSIALAISTGRPWLDRFVSLRGRVAIVDYESGDYEVRRRLKMLGGKDANGVLRSSYSGKDLSDPETWVTLSKLHLDLLIIDSYHAGSPGIEENDAGSDLPLQHAGTFAEKTGCTVIIIHHSRKGSGGDRRESVRGSTAIFAACDRIFEFDDLEKGDGGIVRATLRSIKDGAGKRPEDFRVELDDLGLRFVEGAKPEVEGDNRQIIIEQLTKHPAGLPKADLVALLKGQSQTRRRDLAELSIASIVLEYRQQNTVYVMLNPQHTAK